MSESKIEETGHGISREKKRSEILTRSIVCLGRSRNNSFLNFGLGSKSRNNSMVDLQSILDTTLNGHHLNFQSHAFRNTLYVFFCLKVRKVRSHFLFDLRCCRIIWEEKQHHRIRNAGWHPQCKCILPACFFYYQHVSSYQGLWRTLSNLSKNDMRRRGSGTASKRNSISRWSINGINGLDLVNMLPPDDSDDEAVLLAVSTQVALRKSLLLAMILKLTWVRSQNELTLLFSIVVGTNRSTWHRYCTSATQLKHTIKSVRYLVHSPAYINICISVPNIASNKLALRSFAITMFSLRLLFHCTYNVN